MSERPPWPHAPVHRLGAAGVYMVTAATHRKEHHLHSPERLDLVLNRLFECAAELEWKLEAWSVLVNHYHFVAQTSGDARTLRRLVTKLHMSTARGLNELDGTPGRRVWFQFWDSHITYERSYLARLKYVHFNPEHHGVTTDARTYPWCSAAWFEKVASPAFVATVTRLKTDRIHVPDDF